MPLSEDVFTTTLDPVVQEQIIHQDVRGYGDSTKITFTEYIDTLTVKEFSELMAQLSKELSRLDLLSNAVVHFKDAAKGRLKS